MTKRYVAVSWSEAVRLATLDGTPLSNIRCTYDVELIHRTDWWAWWEDEHLTTALVLPEDLRPEYLSADSAALIFDVWAGGLSKPQCGWSTLAKVKSVVDREIIQTADMTSDNAASSWEKLTLLFDCERRGFLYRHRYQEGADYRCNVTFTPP